MEVAWSGRARTLGWRCAVERATDPGPARPQRGGSRRPFVRSLIVPWSSIAPILPSDASRSAVADRPRGRSSLVEAGLVEPTDDADTIVATWRSRVAKVRQLTNREGEIILLVGHGLTSSEIAASFGLCPSAPSMLISTTFDKSDVGSSGGRVVLTSLFCGPRVST